jgi:hypothetical protein
VAVRDLRMTLVKGREARRATMTAARTAAISVAGSVSSSEKPIPKPVPTTVVTIPAVPITVCRHASKEMVGVPGSTRSSPSDA